MNSNFFSLVCIPFNFSTDYGNLAHKLIQNNLYIKSNNQYKYFYSYINPKISEKGEPYVLELTKEEAINLTINYKIKAKKNEIDIGIKESKIYLFDSKVGFFVFCLDFKNIKDIAIDDLCFICSRIKDFKFQDDNFKILQNGNPFNLFETFVLNEHSVLSGNVSLFFDNQNNKSAFLINSFTVYSENKVNDEDRIKLISKIEVLANSQPTQFHGYFTDETIIEQGNTLTMFNNINWRMTSQGIANINIVQSNMENKDFVLFDYPKRIKEEYLFMVVWALNQQFSLINFSTKLLSNKSLQDTQSLLLKLNEFKMKYTTISIFSHLENYREFYDLLVQSLNIDKFLSDIDKKINSENERQSIKTNIQASTQQKKQNEHAFRNTLITTVISLFSFISITASLIDTFQIDNTVANFSLIFLCVFLCGFIFIGIIYGFHKFSVFLKNKKSQDKSINLINLQSMSKNEYNNRFPILLVNHKKIWSIAYMIEAIKVKSIISSIDKNAVKFIRHFGSTSIRNIKAKPIIDIMVGISQKIDLNALIDLMCKKGYFYCVDEGVSAPHIIFKKGYNAKSGFSKFVYHIHIRYSNQEQIELRFAEFIRTNNTYAKQYELLKEKLYSEFEYDRDKYNSGKTEFIKKINSKISNKNKRVFIALNFSDEEQSKISKILESHKLQCTNLKNLHLTLAYLPNISQAKLIKAVKYIKSQKVKMQLSINSIGNIAATNDTIVLFVKKNKDLQKLYNGLTAKLKRLNIYKDDLYEFKPHITVAYNKTFKLKSFDENIIIGNLTILQKNMDGLYVVPKIKDNLL